jgi:ATP:ADP antiporter, AAA family
MLKRLVDIRAGEGKRALLACASLLLVIAAYTMVKSVRDALFLSKFGITELSLMAVGLAVVTSFIISIYLRGTAGLSRNLLIWGTNVVIAGTLALIWLGTFSAGLANVIPWALYIWSSIFGVFIVMQFWLLASDLFDTREAKRLYGFVGAGAILGGVSGGFLSRSLAAGIGASNMLLVAGGMLLLEAVLVSFVWPLRKKEEAPRSKPKPAQGPKPKPKGGLATVLEHPSVRLLAAAVLLMTIATTLLDWQFKGIVKAEYAGRTNEMAGFFGSLYAYLSVASFLIQTLLTGTILRRFGVGIGLLMLPTGLMLGSGLILTHTVLPFISRLTAASTAKVVDGGLRFAVDKASMELMWLPVPPDVKERGKSFVDTVIDRLGTGVTGFIWLGLAALGLGHPSKIHWISIAVMAIVVVWLVVIFNARSAYLVTLREALSTRKLDLDRVPINLVDAEAQRTLATTLASSDPREVHFALYLLDDVAGPLPALDAPLAHEEASVRVAALKLLTRRKDRAHREKAVAGLTHADSAVQEATILYLHATAPQGSDPVVERLAQNAEVHPTTVHVIKLGLPDYAMAAADDLRASLQEGGPAERVDIVRMLSGAPPEMAAALLAPALQDDDEHVVRAALVASGRAHAEGLVPQIAAMLERPGRRRAAADALRAMGAVAVDQLTAKLAQSEPIVQRVLVQLLGSMGEPRVAGALFEHLDTADGDLARRALRALNRLRTRAGLTLEQAQLERVDAMIERELQDLYRGLLFLQRGSWADQRHAEPAEALLERVLAERADAGVERIFRLLALRHNPQDLYAAYLGVRSPLKSIRSSSAEFLDNVLPKELTLKLLPLLEDAGAKHFASVAQQLSGLKPESRVDLLRRQLGAQDEALAAVAAWTVGVEGLEVLQAELEGALNVGLAKGVAAQAVERIKAGASWEEPKMGLTAIEKALKLQKVDVLQRASTEDLAHIAQIASEVEFEPQATIYGEGDAPDALFVVIAGKVRLHTGDAEIGVVGEGEAFGSWALIDESPRVASATTLEQSTLLKVSRMEFQDLLADRVDIVQAVFKAMVERLRNLANIANNP